MLTHVKVQGLIDFNIDNNLLEKLKKRRKIKINIILHSNEVDWQLHIAVKSSFIHFTKSCNEKPKLFTLLLCSNIALLYHAG